MKLYVHAAHQRLNLMAGLVQGTAGPLHPVGKIAVQRKRDAQRGGDLPVLAQRHRDAPDAPGALLAFEGKPCAADFRKLISQRVEIRDGVFCQRVQPVIVQGLELPQRVQQRRDTAFGDAQPHRQLAEGVAAGGAAAQFQNVQRAGEGTVGVCLRHKVTSGETLRLFGYPNTSDRFWGGD